MAKEKKDLEEQRLQIEQDRRKVMEQIVEQRRQEDIRDAAAHFDTKDFKPSEAGAKAAFTARWDAFRRIMLIAGSLPSERIRSLARDWTAWDHGQALRFHLGDDWPLRYMKIMQKLMGDVANGRLEAVSAWWETQLERAAPPDLILPALAAEVPA